MNSLTQSAIRGPQSAIAFGLLPYQADFSANPSRFKIGLWARETGKDHTATFEAVVDSIRNPGTTWIIVAVLQREGIPVYTPTPEDLTPNTNQCSSLPAVAASLQGAPNAPNAPNGSSSRREESHENPVFDLHDLSGQTKSKISNESNEP